MIKFLLFISIFLVCSQLKAQYKIDEFGDVSIADLEMKECSFEKDANAMYLFSHGKIYRHDPYEVSFEVHKRIKIFNDKGKAEANIRLEFFGNKRNGFEEISGLQAQTINLVDGKVEITKIDKKAVYNENLDLLKSAKTFSFPNVKDGSIIEYKYSIRTAYLPPWNFQSNIPVRYSELTTDFPDSFNFTILSHGLSNLVKNTKVKKGRGLDDDVINTRGMAEIPSLVSEPFMSSRVDNLVSISHYPSRSDNTWEKIYTDLLEDEDFGSQFGKKLNGEKVLISKAITLKNDADKIAFLFNEVRNSMKWNGTNSCYADDGVTKSWEKKIGNSAEINFILYRLLKESGIKVYPMLVSTKEHGIFNKNIPRLGQLDKTIAYIPIDSNSAYYLDASDKYQTFNSIPEFLLNKNGFCVNKSTKKPEFVFIQKTSPVRNSIFIKAQISSNGQLKGTVITSNQDYFKLELTKLYKKEGEEKFKDYLRNNDPNIKITSLNLTNLEVDTLPLLQTADFEMNLVGSDDQYVYVSTNLFSTLRINPFVSENRNTDIHFGYKNVISILGVYQVPPGFKAEALPENISLIMPDKSMTFKRISSESDNSITIKVAVDSSANIHFKENYPDLREFYKKMFELLNEQIVLKKL